MAKTDPLTFNEAAQILYKINPSLRYRSYCCRSPIYSKLATTLRRIPGLFLRLLHATGVLWLLSALFWLLEMAVKLTLTVMSITIAVTAIASPKTLDWIFYSIDQAIYAALVHN